MSTIFVTAWSFLHLRFSEMPIWAILFQFVYSYFYFQPLYLNLPFSCSVLSKSIYLVYLFKLLPLVFAINMLILHYSAGMFSFICTCFASLPFLLSRDFCDSPHLICWDYWFLGTMSSVPHEFGMTVSFSLGILHFPQDSHLPRGP